MRVGVCVPFASLATLALSGSEDLDAFALEIAIEQSEREG